MTMHVQLSTGVYALWSLNFLDPDSFVYPYAIGQILLDFNCEHT